MPGAVDGILTRLGTVLRADRVLSNFLGRGTDAIEAFLLGRPCVGVDLNPVSVGAC